MWKNEKGHYYAYINGRNVSLKTKNHHEAKKAYSKLVTGPIKVSVKERILGYYCKLYIDYKRDDKTQLSMKVMKPFWPVPVDKIDGDDLHRYLQSLGKKSMWTLYISIHAMINKYKLPIVLPKMPQKKSIRFLSYDEERKLFELADDEMRFILNLFLQTGLRRGEAFSLRWGDIHGDLMLIHGKKKRDGSNNDRMIPTPPVLKKSDRGEGRVITGFTDADAIRKKFKRHAIRCGIQDVSIHTLRHTFATRLATQKISGHVLQHWLGHESITTTARYVHLKGADLLAYADIIPDTTDV